MASVIEAVAERAAERAAVRELETRMQRPQRHRLLHGYPLRRVMSRPAGGASELRFAPETGRELLVGVLGHPYCNPTVPGCGFCTFPHQSYRADKARQLVACVRREISGRVEREPGLAGRRVAGLYFGGATANLTPAGAFRELCRTLAEVFDLSEAEVTLEGVPSYFLRRRPSLLEILHDELPARQFRISMGIQTFSAEQLERMGRRAFGDAKTFQRVVERAHAAGFSVSADLLCNLPHQSLEQMQVDLARASEIGLDHIGLYHLVLFEGLGTPWSQEPSLLAGVPDNRVAAENWQALRRQLHALGFVQTTLTNFERAELRGSERRFQYEELSYQPERVDVLGFGPAAISYAADREFQSARKTLNPERAEEYMGALAGDRAAAAIEFDYRPWDLRILYLTRRLAALDIDRASYMALFDSDAYTDFVDEIAALRDAGLVDVSLRRIRPTPRGMFYADSIAGLLASRRLRELRTLSPSRLSTRRAWIGSAAAEQAERQWDLARNGTRRPYDDAWDDNSAGFM